MWYNGKEVQILDGCYLRSRVSWYPRWQSIGLIKHGLVSCWVLGMSIWPGWAEFNFNFIYQCSLMAKDSQWDWKNIQTPLGQTWSNLVNTPRFSGFDRNSANLSKAVRVGLLSEWSLPLLLLNCLIIVPNSKEISNVSLKCKGCSLFHSHLAVVVLLCRRSHRALLYQPHLAPSVSYVSNSIWRICRALVKNHSWS